MMSEQPASLTPRMSTHSSETRSYHGGTTIDSPNTPPGLYLELRLVSTNGLERSRQSVSMLPRVRIKSIKTLLRR